MAKFKQLHDLYRFPGFVPQPHVRGIFGDPMAVVISLKRCRKKRSVASADKPISVIMTSGVDVFAICRVGTSGSICLSFFGGYFALGAKA